MIEQAKKLATEAHKGQLYGTGEPYIVHPTQAADLARRLGYPDEVIAACYLHDVLEDTDITEAELREKFPDVVVDAVVAVTFMGKDSDAKLKKAISHPVGHAVKFCDSSSNFSNSALYGPRPGKDLKEVLTRYTHYLSVLSHNLPTPEQIKAYLKA